MHCQLIKQLLCFSGDSHQLETRHIYSIFIDHEAIEIMYLVALTCLFVHPSVRPFVCRCLFVRALLFEGWSLLVQRVCLCACNQGAYADHLADAFDRLLIYSIFISNPFEVFTGPVSTGQPQSKFDEK